MATLAADAEAEALLTSDEQELDLRFRAVRLVGNSCVIRVLDTRGELLESHHIVTAKVPATRSR